MAEDVISQRADARRNRQSLLQAAGLLITERGTDFPLKQVADRAGVGVGTLYRNFRDRDELFLALRDQAATEMRALAATAAAAPTGWEAVQAYVDGCVALHERFPWLLIMRGEYRYQRLPDPAEVKTGEQIVDRAHREGTLRLDAGIIEVASAANMLAGMTYLPEPILAAIIPRLRTIVLDGLRRDRGDFTTSALTAAHVTDLVTTHTALQPRR